MTDKEVLEHIAKCDRAELNYWKGAVEQMIVFREAEGKNETK